MKPLISLIQAAGLIQLAIAAGNIWVPGKVNARENLARVSPMTRSIFIVHWVYIVLVLVIFGLLCVFFAPELASGSALARFLCGAMGVFWLARVFIQFFYYDAALRRQHRAADISFLLAVLFLGSVFAVAALGWAS